jgi:ribosomal protein S4
MCKPKDVISVSMKKTSLKLVNKNLQEYSEKMRFYKKRLEKTLAYILFKLEFSSTMTGALELINAGKVQINNRKMKMPNYICSPKDVISVLTEKGNSPRKIKLAEYLRTI